MEESPGHVGLPDYWFEPGTALEVLQVLHLLARLCYSTLLLMIEP